MKNEAAVFLLSLQFLTRLPINSDKYYTPERLNAAARYYPLVGYLIGAFCGGVFVVFSFALPDPIALLLAMASGLLLTGAFHEDGLADTFDGIGGGHTRAQALDIMKDSRLGTYGTLALIIALAIKFMSLIALPSQLILIAFILGHGLSRLSSVFVILTSRYARTDGKAKPVADGLSSASTIIAVTCGCLGLIGASYFLPWPALGAGLAGLLVGHVLMRLLFEPKLRGYTGDTLGAVQQSSELCFYLGLIAWLS